MRIAAPTSLKRRADARWMVATAGILVTSFANGAQRANAAAPTITSISVISVTTPSAAFTFTVTGTNFVVPSRRQRGTEVASEAYGRVSCTVNSSTEITVNVPPLEAVSTAVTLKLYVETPHVGRSAASTDIAFSINPPIQGSPPTLDSLSESSVTTPTAAFTFTATGTNFVAGTTALPFHTRLVSVEWGPLRTTVTSPTELTIQMPELRRVRKAVVLHLYVENPDLTQSSTASELTFTINPPVPATPPTLTSLSVTSVTPPVRDFTFTVTGSGFVGGEHERDSSRVWSEEYGPLDTTVNSDTELTVTFRHIKTVSDPMVLHLYVQNPDGTRSPASEDIAFTIE